jgi:ABC-2 type transport system permease protein
MSRALQAELIKLRTTRTFLALTASALGLSLLIVVLVTSLDSGLEGDELRSVFLADMTGLFILLLGAIGMSGEWRHRTIAASVLSIPQRLVLLAAKVLSYALAGVVLSLVVNLAIMAVGSLVLSARGEEKLALVDLADVLWRNLTVAAFYAAFGVCVGALIRNSAGAIVLLLAVLFVLEPALWGLAPDVGKFGPLQAAPTGVVEGEGMNGDGEGVLAAGAALLVLFAWLGALFAAAMAAFTRRDLI